MTHSLGTLTLPEGRERERVDDYRLRGSEVANLATVGAFRAVPRDDLERQSVDARPARSNASARLALSRQRLT